jgi:ABC-type polar amino acid transport system ATPase subunit
MACGSSNNKAKMEELTKKLNDIQSLEKVNVNLNGFEVVFEDGDWTSKKTLTLAKSIALLDPAKESNVPENDSVKKLKEETKQIDEEIEKLEKECLVKVSQLYLMAQMVINLLTLQHCEIKSEMNIIFEKMGLVVYDDDDVQ